MHFTFFQARNAGPFDDLQIEMDQGSIGIFGPNGTGKTTVLNFLYALVTNDFGRFDGVKADCIRNTAEAKTESYIYGRIEHNGHKLSIKRGLYPAKTSVMIDEDGIEITDANKAQEEIDKILGVDRKMLSMYAFKPQDGIYDFISAQPAERAKAFAVLCRTEGCEAIYEFLGKFLGKNSEINAVIEDNSDELVTQISNLKGQVAEYEASIKTESEKLLNSKSEATAREILRKQDRLEDFIAQREKEQQRYEQARASHKELVVRRDKREKKYLLLKEKVAETQPTADEARASLKAWQQYAKQRARRRQLKDELLALQNEENKNPAPEPKTWELSLSELRSNLAKWKQQLKDAHASLATLEATGLTACPTCHTPVADLHDHIEEQKQLIKSRPKDIAACESCIEEIEDHQQRVRKYEKWRAGYDARLEANQQARESLKDIKAPEGTEEEYAKIIEDYDGLTKDLAEAKQSYDEMVTQVAACEEKGKAAKRRLAELATAIEENTESEDRVEKARQRLDEHTAARQNVAKLEGQLEGVTGQIEARETDLAKLKAKLKRSKKIRKNAAIAETVRDLMHRNCLPRRVAQANLSQMEGDINEGLGFFGDPFWVESDENLSFVVHKPGEPPQPAARLSTGQRVVLALSFWPAVASLWSSDLGILALDEPTANLDEGNRKFLSDALGTLTAKVRGRRQLIMVTHDQNLRTAFDQVIDLGG